MKLHLWPVLLLAAACRGASSEPKAPVQAERPAAPAVSAHPGELDGLWTMHNFAGIPGVAYVYRNGVRSNDRIVDMLITTTGPDAYDMKIAAQVGKAVSPGEPATPFHLKVSGSVIEGTMSSPGNPDKSPETCGPCITREFVDEKNCAPYLLSIQLGRIPPPKK